MSILKTLNEIISVEIDELTITYSNDPKAVYSAEARRLLREGDKELKLNNDDSIEKAAHSYFLAIHYAEKTGDQEFAEKIREKTPIQKGQKFEDYLKSIGITPKNKKILEKKINPL
ncbi:hypothetical protein HY643_01875 [Candidatus Woesearchaeota archaeon]|nr:hypothetical protein [Candidatus Woesearchaeota archaeon]